MVQIDWVSAWIKPSSFCHAIGRWSFGIYLAHFVFVKAFQQLSLRLGLLTPVQTPLPGILSLTLLSFLSSLLLCAAVERLNRPLLNATFGLRP